MSTGALCEPADTTTAAVKSWRQPDDALGTASPGAVECAPRHPGLANSSPEFVLAEDFTAAFLNVGFSALAFAA